METVTNTVEEAKPYTTEELIDSMSELILPCQTMYGICAKYITEIEAKMKDEASEKVILEMREDVEYYRMRMDEISTGLPVLRDMIGYLRGLMIKEEE